MTRLVHPRIGGDNTPLSGITEVPQHGPGTQPYHGSQNGHWLMSTFSNSHPLRGITFASLLGCRHVHA